MALALMGGILIDSLCLRLKLVSQLSLLSLM